MIYRKQVSEFFIAYIGLVSAALRQPGFPLGGSGKVIQITSANDFCTFLPPSPNVSIVDSEGYPTTDPVLSAPFAVAYCTNPKTAPAGAKPIYDGFITGVTFHKEAGFISVSGTIDPSKAGLKLDGGGYYDLDNNVNSPPGGICQGYDSFYNQVNPADGIFCVKCCVGITGCRIDLAETVNGGCRGMVPGNYSRGFTTETWPKTGVTVVNGVVTGTTNPSTGMSSETPHLANHNFTEPTSTKNSGNVIVKRWIGGVAGLLLALYRV